MNCKTAKLINLVSYLIKQGFRTGKTNTKEVWFYSPFRKNERTPSFKVDITKNAWYDFSEGVGGTIIDFITKYNNCSIKEALVILSEGTFSFHQQKEQLIIEQKPTYSIKKVTELTNQKLLSYLSSRRINLKFAKRFCCQVHFSFKDGKELYSIGFMNNYGGFEVNFPRKFCLGKKEITTINNNSDVVSIFESWSDFLSYLTLKKEIPKENFIILNSTSLVKKTIELLDEYSTIKLFFDNDEAGNKATNFIVENANGKIIDNRIHYKNFDDLNDYLIAINTKNKR